MIIQPKLLKLNAQYVPSRIFVCGPGYGSAGLTVREQAKAHLQSFPSTSAFYGEELESMYGYKKKGTDLQTLEAQFAHDVDFTLLILDSPGSIAELGTFSQFNGLRGRLIVLVARKFYKDKSYISRGPLSLISNDNQNNIIYYDLDNVADMLSRVSYPLTFFKFAHHFSRNDYIKSTRLRQGAEPSKYTQYISPIKQQFFMAISLVSMLVVEGASYADLLFISGLAPKQLNAALHELFLAAKIEKFGSGKYRSIYGYSDDLLRAFDSTQVSRARAKLMASA